MGPFFIITDVEHIPLVFFKKVVMKNKFIRRLTILVCFIIVVIAFHTSGVRSYLTLDTLKMQSESLRAFVDRHYFFSVGFFILCYFLNVAFCLPGAFLFTLGSGYLYGSMLGACYSLTGATLGSMAGFFMVRYGIGDFLQERYEHKLVWFNAAIERYGILFLLGIHLVAIVPLVAVNILAGISKIPAWTFLWTTAVSIIPLALVYSFAGSQLQTITSARDIFTGPVMIALALLALAAYLPVVYTRFVLKTTINNK